MDPLYVRAQATASRLLDKYGKAITVVRGGVSHVGRGVEQVVKIASDAEFEKDSMTEQNSRRVILSTAGMTIVPKPGDTAKLGSSAVVWQVAGCTPLSPIDNTIYYRMALVK